MYCITHLGSQVNSHPRERCELNVFTFELRKETQSRQFGSLLGSSIHLNKMLPADVASIDL